MIKRISSILFVYVFSAFGGHYLHAQNKSVTLEEAITLAISNNNELESYRLKAEQSKRLRGEAFDPGSTTLNYSYDENNVAENDLPLKVIGIGQSFDFPSIYFARLKAAKDQAEIDRLIYEIKRNEISKKVSQNYYNILLIQSQMPLYRRLDSMYSSIIAAAERRYTTGESNYLQSLTIRSHALQLKTSYLNANEDLRNELQKLQSLIQSDSLVDVPPQQMEQIQIFAPELDQHYGMMLQTEYEDLSKSRLITERNQLLPGFSLEYFQGTNSGVNAKIYPGFAVGISVPLFFGAQNARIQSAKIEREISRANSLNYSALLKSRSEEIFTEIRKYGQVIDQYNQLGKKTAEEIMKYARRAFEEGEIDFHVYITSLEEAINLELDFLENLNRYNQAVLELKYLNLD